MKLDTSQRVYTCEEFGEVGIPMQEILVGGNLDIYPEIASRGFFDIDYRRGQLVMRATKYVGLIPVSSRVAIHVRPRAPIGNLMWLAWRSGDALPRLDGVMRGYAATSGEIESPEALYVDAFLASLERIASGAVLKRYRSGETEGAPQGRLSISRSVGRYYSRGIRHRHVCSPTELTVDNPEHRVLKQTATRVLMFLKSSQRNDAPALVARLARALAHLRMVDESGVTESLVARTATRLIRALPATHSHYDAPLWLSYLVATRGAVSVEQIGPARLETIVLNASDLFESYVRRVCEEARDSLACDVRNGNQLPLTLFRTGNSASIKPDVYFVRDKRVVAVADAKYKARPSEDDRYAMIAYCDATGASRGALILPAAKATDCSAFIGATLGGKRLDVVRINLAAPDMRSEEEKFLGEIRALVTSAPAPPSS